MSESDGIANSPTGAILASGHAAIVELDEATVSGGKLETVSAGQIDVIGSGNALSGVMVVSASQIAIEGGGVLTLSGGTVGAGAAVKTTSGGTLMVSSIVANGGTLYASGSGSLVEITTGAVVSGGIVEVGNGVVDIQSGGDANVTFLAGGSGGLELEGSGILAVRVSGFGVSGGSAHKDHAEYIDFTGFGSGATFTYTSGNTSNTSGTLTVSSGGVSGSVVLVGSYTQANFSSGTIDGTIAITDPAGGVVNGGEVHSANIALFGSYIASFAAGGHGGLVITSTGQTEQPLLVHPRA